MRSLAKAYKRIKRESEGFRLTKDEFIIYVSFLFPMFRTKLLKLPIKRKLIFLPMDEKNLPHLGVHSNYVEIAFEDVWDYLNKRVIKLQEKF